MALTKSFSHNSSAMYETCFFSLFIQVNLWEFFKSQICEPTSILSFDIQICVCRFLRDLSRCQRWLWGSFTQPFGLGETATPAGRKAFIKLSVNLTVLYQTPSDCLAVLLADSRTTFIWYMYTSACTNTNLLKEGKLIHTSANYESCCEEIKFYNLKHL